MNDPQDRAGRERERIRKAHPAEFNDGVKRAFAGDPNYPAGFTAWPLDRRNAWFAGFNIGYVYRKSRRAPDHKGGPR